MIGLARSSEKSGLFFVYLLNTVLIHILRFLIKSLALPGLFLYRFTVFIYTISA